MTDRNDIISRIANLRGLADSTGSENEAMASLRIADKLMAAYRIEEAEIAMAEATGSVKVEVVSEQQGGINVGRNRHKVQLCIWMVADYCEVKAVLNTRWGEQRINWIGDKPDVELAKYLIAMIAEAMESEYARWKRSQQAVGRAAKGTFQIAMASQINTRLRQMVSERAAERKQLLLDAKATLTPEEGAKLGIAVGNGDISQLTDTGLVVVAAVEAKRIEVDRAYNERYGKVRLGTAKGFSYRSGGNATAGGRAAGARVNLGRPIGQANNARLAG